MRFSLRTLRNAALVALLLAIPVLLLRSTLQDPQRMSNFDRAVRRIGAPLEAGLAYSAGWVGSFFERWIFQAQMMDEKERLQDENRELRRRMRELALIEEENRQLRRFLGLRDQIADDLLPAEVTGVEQSPFFRVVKLNIDRGDRYVRPGMAVLAADGVVGRIHKAYDTHADVMLVTDAGSKIAVEITRSRAPGILVGASEDGCLLELAVDDDVEVGDLVQTSGVDDLFPKGRPVGRVVQIDERNDKKVLDVVPLVRFDRLDAVWVVLANAPVADPDAGAPTPRVVSRGIQPLR